MSSKPCKHGILRYDGLCDVCQLERDLAAAVAAKEKAERERQIDRLDRMVAAMMTGPELPWQPSDDGKTRSYEAFVAAEAAGYLAAIDAAVKERKQ